MSERQDDAATGGAEGAAQGEDNALPTDWGDARHVINRNFIRHEDRIAKLEAGYAAVAEMQTDLHSLRREIHAMNTGMMEVNRLALNEANAARIERRYNGQIYQKLNERLDADKELRDAYYANDGLRMQFEKSRLNWAKAIFWAIVALCGIGLFAAFR